MVITVFCESSNISKAVFPNELDGETEAETSDVGLGDFEPWTFRGDCCKSYISIQFSPELSTLGRCRTTYKHGSISRRRRINLPPLRGRLDMRITHATISLFLQLNLDDTLLGRLRVFVHGRPQVHAFESQPFCILHGSVSRNGSVDAHVAEDATRCGRCDGCSGHCVVNLT